MKLKLLRKTDEDKDSRTYSYYENPDKELVEKIKNHPKPTKISNVGIFKNDIEWEFKKVLDNVKYLIESTDGDVQTISKEQFDDYVKNEHLENINKTYLVSETFNKYFIPFQNGYSQILEVTDKHLYGSFSDGVNSIFDSESWGIQDHTSNYINGTQTKEFSFKYSRGVGSGHLYFNENGEIVNRDYNENLNIQEPFVSKTEAVKQVIEFLSKALPDTLEVSATKTYFIEGYSINVFEHDKYNSDVCVTTFFTPEQSQGTYYVPGQSYSKIKKPKKGLIEVPKSVLLDEFESLLKNKILNLSANTNEIAHLIL